MQHEVYNESESVPRDVNRMYPSEEKEDVDHNVCRNTISVKGAGEWYGNSATYVWSNFSIDAPIDGDQDR